MIEKGSADVIHLHPNDDVCVAVSDLDAGSPLHMDDRQITLAHAVPMGHKVAVNEIACGQPVHKYGQIIGLATQDIGRGDWVHSHNLAIGEFARDGAAASEVPPALTPITDRSFEGFRRANGKSGTRNYIAVISTVNCSASVAKYIARHFDRESLQAYSNVDGVVAFTHQGGCGIQFGGYAHEMLNRVLAGIATHPNIGAYLLIGLGCEQATIESLLDAHPLVQIGGAAQAADSIPVFTMQDQGGTRKTVEAGVRAVEEMLPQVNSATRETIPASEIILATECGGSDGNSGITANPAVGVASDMIVACGGTVILSETSEIYGAEHLLTRRARNAGVAKKLMDRLEWWKKYVGMYGVELDNNPSVGNKAGGLTTIAEKSLGAVAKAGSTALENVYQYAESVQTKGLVVMDTPGYDPPSVTGMVAGGANVVVFTTGRGSCFGCKPAPTIKIATNSPMYAKMEEDMDINAGVILAGTPLADIGQDIFEEILTVASGKKTKSETQGIGDEEFVPWTVGPTL